MNMLTDLVDHVIGVDPDRDRVTEFDRPATRAARDGAKSDGPDAVRAARELLGGEKWAQLRARGTREAMRALLVDATAHSAPGSRRSIR